MVNSSNQFIRYCNTGNVNELKKMLADVTNFKLTKILCKNGIENTIEKGNLEIVKLLLGAKNFDINQIKIFFSIAIFYNKPEIATWFYQNYSFKIAEIDNEIMRKIKYDPNNSKILMTFEQQEKKILDEFNNVLAKNNLANLKTLQTNHNLSAVFFSKMINMKNIKDVKIMKWLCSKKLLNINSVKKIFDLNCEKENLPIVKWIYNNYNLKIAKYKFDIYLKNSKNDFQNG